MSPYILPKRIYVISCYMKDMFDAVTIESVETK